MSSMNLSGAAAEWKTNLVKQDQSTPELLSSHWKPTNREAESELELGQFCLLLILTVSPTDNMCVAALRPTLRCAPSMCKVK